MLTFFLVKKKNQIQFKLEIYIKHLGKPVSKSDDVVPLNNL